MTELEHKAAEAWAAMLHPARPMPAGVALDMTQDVCGDRDDAVAALLDAAARWLDRLRPEPESDRPSASFGAAVRCRGHLLGEAWGLAEIVRECLLLSYRDVRLNAVLRGQVGSPAAELARRWCDWCVHAATAIRLGKEVAEAAHPIDAK